MKRRDILFAVSAALFAALFHWLAYGDQFGENGYHWQYLPALFSRLDPGLYSRDAFVGTLSDLPTLFWTGVARIVVLLDSSPERVMSWLYLITLLGAYFALALLALELAGGMGAAAIAVGLFLLSPFLHDYGLLSHDKILRSHLDQTLFSLPFWLFSFWLWLRGRKGWAYAVAGLAFNFNAPLSLGLAACMAGADYLSLYMGKNGDRHHFSKTRGAPQIRKCSVSPYAPALFLPASLPVWWKISGGLFASVAGSDWAAALRLWYPWHYFPGAWTWTQWLYILSHGLLLGSLIVIAFGKLRPRPEILRFSIIVVAFWMISSLFAEVVPLRWVISLQGLRLDGFMTILGLAAGGVVVGNLLTDSRLGLKGVWLAGVLWCALAARSPSIFPAAFVAPGVFFLGMESRRLGYLKESGSGAWFAGVILVCSFVILGFAPGLHFSKSVLLPTALFAALYLLTNEKGGAVNVWVILCLALTAFLFFADAAIAGIESRRFHLRKPHVISERKVEEWLRLNTPKDALILAVPVRRDLRVGSRRSMAGQWIDGAAMHWNPDFAGAWKENMGRLGFIFHRVPLKHRNEALGHFRILKGSLSRVGNLRVWDSSDVDNLIEFYRPDWAVSTYPLPSDRLRMAFRSGRFVVYKVTSAAR